MAFKKKTSLAISILAPFLAYFLIFAQGWLQKFELALYDWYLKSRPTESVERRIVIVGITEKDLQKLNQSNIDDGTLVKVLEKIKAHNPQIIGLDLYRNLPVCFDSAVCEKDSRKLAAIFRNTPNLIGIEKTNRGNPHEQTILPHPELAKKERTGDNTVIEDKDRRIRRAYFYVTDSAQKNKYSFGAKIALNYLPKELSQYSKDQGWFKLNNAIFPEIKRTETKEKGLFKKLITKLKELGKIYSADEIDNYQILLNYRQNENSFKQLSIFQILEGDFKDEELRDKIVLIGAVYEPSGDIFYVPYLESEIDFVYGIEFHAQVVSYLVNAALEERTVFKFAPRLVELILIVFLLSESPLFIYWLDKKQQKELNLLILSAFQIVVILAGTWLSLYFGYWLPGANMIFITSLNLAILNIFIYHHRQEEEKLKLEEQVKQRTKSLKQALDDLQNLQQKMIAHEKLVAYQKLAHTLSHEIKNQTSSLRLNAQYCYQNLSEIKEIINDEYFLFGDSEEDLDFVDPRKLCERGLEQLSRIEDLVEKITSILQELNQNSGRNSLQVKSLDLNKLLQIIVAESTQTKPIENLRIESNYDSSLSNITGIAQHLERALQNILLNACDSLLSKSKKLPDYLPVLELGTQEQGEEIEIIIRDNGEGIPEQERDKIFQMNWTTKSETGGKGLGLYFARDLILEHGGQINVDSQLGEYTEFIIQLPKNRLGT